MMSKVFFKTVNIYPNNSGDSPSLRLYSCDDLTPSSYSVLPQKWIPIFEKGSDILCVTNPYWLQFDPPTWTIQVIWFILYLILFVFGTLGNFLVIYFFLSSRILRTPSNVFIFNLAFSDFIMVFKIVITLFNISSQGPSTGQIGCDIFAFFGGITGTCSIMTLSAIALDRYLVIAFPLDPFKKLTYRQIVCIIVCIWIYSGIFSVIPLAGIEGITYAPEGFLTSCSFDYLTNLPKTRFFIWAFFFGAWVLPLGIIIFCYTSILVIVKRQEKQYSYNAKSHKRTSVESSATTLKNAIRASMKRTKQLSGSSEVPRTSFRHQKHHSKTNSEMKLARIACFIVFLWIAAWTPYAIVALLGITGRRHLITPLISMIPALLCKSAACLDPYIYALSHPRFKKEIQKRIVFRFRRWLCSSTAARREPNRMNSKIESVSSSIELHELKETSKIDTPKCEPSFAPFVIPSNYDETHCKGKSFEGCEECSQSAFDRNIIKHSSTSLKSNPVYFTNRERSLQRSHSVAVSNFIGLFNSSTKPDESVWLSERGSNSRSSSIALRKKSIEEQKRNLTFVNINFDLSEVQSLERSKELLANEFGTCQKMPGSEYSKSDEFVVQGPGGQKSNANAIGTIRMTTRNSFFMRRTKSFPIFGYSQSLIIK